MAELLQEDNRSYQTYILAIYSGFKQVRRALDSDDGIVFISATAGFILNSLEFLVLSISCME